MPVSSGLHPEPTRERGLSGEEAARLLAEYGSNALAPPAAVSLWSRVFAQLRDPLIWCCWPRWS